MQTGFDTEANEVGTQLNRLREVADGKRREAEQKLYKQRLWALQLSQKSELNKMNRELEAKKAAAEARWKEEVDALNAKQAAEYQKKVRATQGLDQSTRDLRVACCSHARSPTAADRWRLSQRPRRSRRWSCRSGSSSTVTGRRLSCRPSRRPHAI